MAKSKKKIEKKEIVPAEVTLQPITDTIEKNYMPYVMSVIVSRAIPEIDGFKPSHRKLLYTMYKMGLLTGHRTKSANVVGQTMRLNPHGDMAIYETMVRLTRGNEALERYTAATWRLPHRVIPRSSSTPSATRSSAASIRMPSISSTTTTTR